MSYRRVGLSRTFVLSFGLRPMRAASWLGFFFCVLVFNRFYFRVLPLLALLLLGRWAGRLPADGGSAAPDGPVPPRPAVSAAVDMLPAAGRPLAPAHWMRWAGVRGRPAVLARPGRLPPGAAVVRAGRRAGRGAAK